jgi:transcriptional regulator with XRE-family HTH domain
MKKADVDPAILKARKLFAASGKSLDELGRLMGAEGDVARKSAWQFLNSVSDPKLGTLRRFAKAMGVPVEELVSEKKKRPTD